jgi:hypothetical protein
VHAFQRNAFQECSGRDTVVAQLEFYTRNMLDLVIIMVSATFSCFGYNMVAYRTRFTATSLPIHGRLLYPNSTIA